MEHAASRTNWESSAATYNGQSDRLGDRSPASPSTSAGPTACQAVTTRRATRPSRSEPRVLVEAADHDPGRDGERNEPHREHEQHRHENQLRRHCGAGPHLEVEPERGCVRTDQDEHREDARAPLGRDEHRHQQGDRDEASGEDDERQELPPREALKAPGAPLLDDALLVWVEEGGARSVGRSGHRSEDIVLERRSLDAP